MNKESITIVSGAGISQPSGIPTFRGKDGLWQKYSATELANPTAFQKNPKLVWEWYAWRIESILGSRPNPAHIAIKELEDKGYDVVILTQNVDNLHEQTGTKNVIHLHGEILKARCTSCNRKLTWNRELIFNTPLPPVCGVCNSLMRPHVVWFTESLPEKILQSAIDRLSITDILFIVGTSGVVYPVAEFPFLAKRHHPLVKIYEFNISETDLSRSNVITDSFLGSVEHTLPYFIRENF